MATRPPRASRPALTFTAPLWEYEGTGAWIFVKKSIRVGEGLEIGSTARIEITLVL